jgi:hypothetical protein
VMCCGAWQAMPVTLTGEDCDIWFEAPISIAPELQRLLPPERLAVVAIGLLQDAAA